MTPLHPKGDIAPPEGRPNTIWVVIGESGEFDCFRTWPVCAYFDESLARRHAEEATAWWAANLPPQSYDMGKKADDIRARRRLWLASQPCPYDPHVVTSHGDAEWTVHHIPIRTSVPVPPASE